MTVDLELADRFVRHLRIYARGEAKAITAVELCPALGLPATAQSRRHLRAAANWAIRNDRLICAGSRGYFSPTTESEARGTAARLRSEAHEMLARAESTERLAERAFVVARPLPAPQSLLELID